MRCLGQLVGLLLVFIVIVISPCAIWTFTTWQVAQNADDYTDSLEDDAYVEMSYLVLPAFSDMVGEIERTDGNTIGSQQAKIFSNVITSLDSDEWQPIVDGLIEPGWVRETINTNLEVTMDFWQFEADTWQLEVDLTPVVSALQGERGERIIDDVVAVVESWEQCDDTEIDKMDEFLDGDTLQFPTCYPGETRLEALRSELLAARDVQLERLATYPNNTFNLRDEVAKDSNNTLEEADRDLHEGRKAFYFIDQTLAVILLIPIMLLALVIVFAVRSAKEFFLWMSLPLILVAVATVLPLLPWMYGMLYGTDSARGPTFGGDARYRLGFQFQRWLFGAFSGPILVQVLVLLVVGFIFILLAAIVRSPQRGKQQSYVYVMPSPQQQVYPQGQYVGPTGQYAQPAPSTPPARPAKRSSAPPPPPPPAQSSEPQVEIITPTPVPTPDSPSPVDRFKDDLDQSGTAADDRTFIPPDSTPPDMKRKD